VKVHWHQFVLMPSSTTPQWPLCRKNLYRARSLRVTMPITFNKHTGNNNRDIDTIMWIYLYHCRPRYISSANLDWNQCAI